MKQVAKLIIIDKNNDHLLMYRSDHPRFGRDPDLPGGTLEPGELPLQTMLREVEEEAGVVMDEALVREVYSGTSYSAPDTHYSLYVARVDERPEVTISWEHSSYEWLGRDEFLRRARSASDTYMHMVHAVLSGRAD